jgi:hypothetical protein
MLEQPLQPGAVPVAVAYEDLLPRHAQAFRST